MTDPVTRIKVEIQGLQEELALINPAFRWNQVRIQDRRQAIRMLSMQLERIERQHQSFLNRRAELAARFHAFRASGGGR